MPRYAITERAGPFVAAHRNTGVGTTLELTERQAEHELRLGTLVRLPEPDQHAAAQPRNEPSVAATAPPDHGSAQAGEQQADSPLQSRKQKRSAT